MLKDLEILNGELTLKFDSLNTIYTINVTEDTSQLDLKYLISPSDHVSIIGNDLDATMNEVVITVYNDKESMSYYLYVLKEKSNQVMNELNASSTLNIEANSHLFKYAIPIISSVCFLTILLLFTFLFSKKK